jgi:TatD DNase family protein
MVEAGAPLRLRKSCQSAPPSSGAILLSVWEPLLVLIDTHCHIQMRQFASDRAAVIAAAFTHGIGRMIVPGTDVPTSREALNLAESYPGRVFVGVGTHPHDASTLTPEALAEQRELARQPGVVAIGEIGLDFYRDLSPRDVQRDALVAQLGLARVLDLPVILHNRESHSDMVALLRAHGGEVRGVFHCFIGDRVMATDALNLGFYLSFAGPLTYPRNHELREVAAWAPADRILVETDSPYLSPQPLRGKRNEPQRVALIAQTLAQTRGVSDDEIADLTTRNAITLFRLPDLIHEPTPDLTP